MRRVAFAVFGLIVASLLSDSVLSGYGTSSGEIALFVYAPYKHKRKRCGTDWRDHVVTLKISYENNKAVSVVPVPEPVGKFFRPASLRAIYEQGEYRLCANLKPAPLEPIPRWLRGTVIFEGVRIRFSDGRVRFSAAPDRGAISGACCLPPLPAWQYWDSYRCGDSSCGRIVRPPANPQICENFRSPAEISRKSCEKIGGVWQGNGSSCGRGTCREEFRVCCAPSPGRNECSLQHPAYCRYFLHGWSLGRDAKCSDERPCLRPPESAQTSDETPGESAPPAEQTQSGVKAEPKRDQAPAEVESTPRSDETPSEAQPAPPVEEAQSEVEAEPKEEEAPREEESTATSDKTPSEVEAAPPIEEAQGEVEPAPPVVEKPDEAEPKAPREVEAEPPSDQTDREAAPESLLGACCFGLPNDTRTTCDVGTREECEAWGGFRFHPGTECELIICAKPQDKSGECQEVLGAWNRQIGGTVRLAPGGRVQGRRGGQLASWECLKDQPEPRIQIKWKGGGEETLTWLRDGEFESLAGNHGTHLVRTRGTTLEGSGSDAAMSEKSVWVYHGVKVSPESGRSRIDWQDGTYQTVSITPSGYNRLKTKLHRGNKVEKLQFEITVPERINDGESIRIRVKGSAKGYLTSKSAEVQRSGIACTNCSIVEIVGDGSHRPFPGRLPQLNSQANEFDKSLLIKPRGSDLMTLRLGMSPREYIEWYYKLEVGQ